MKEFFKNETEKWLSAIGGIVSLVAIYFEMKFADFDAAAIAGGIKDIASTVIAILVLIVAVQALRPKKKNIEGFEAKFNEAMEKIILKYNPLISFYGIESTQKITDAYRYNIANKLDGISTKEPGGNNKFFRVKEGLEGVEFSVSETVFPNRKEAVATRVSLRIKDAHNEFISEAVPSKEGFVLQLKKPLQGETDAETLSSIVDHILLLYIAEYKK